MTDLLFNLQIDCESTQTAVQDAALGERAIRGLGEMLAETGTKGTFLVIPGDITVHASIYRELEQQGHEVGLHYHPWQAERSEFFGVEAPEGQRELLREGIDRFAQAMGRRPFAFCPGYGSANDHTYGILEELGFTHGLVSIPTRDLPQCACVWGNSPLDPHYPHRYNKSLEGDVNFVDLPVTIDPQSRMWGGAHPLDLRVELVDAKNHFYTIDKAIKRQQRDQTPLRQVHSITHNIFEFGDRSNFRRETYMGIVAATKAIAEREGLRFRGATLAEIAEGYREKVPLQSRRVEAPVLDVSGRKFNNQAAA
ncbi:MAG: polysaccharide deacetylase family protein [Chthoniobacterales bacterium]|nr:polysaccharide deacetylase family protein [Chthoniobacterales bacterium]